MESTGHVRRVAKHRRELPDLEILTLATNARLAVEDVMFARALEPDHDWNQEWREHKNGESTSEDVECAFEEFIHGGESFRF